MNFQEYRAQKLMIFFVHFTLKRQNCPEDEASFLCHCRRFLDDWSGLDDVAEGACCFIMLLARMTQWTGCMVISN